MTTCANLSMWTQQQLPLLQFHCGPLWLELQPYQVNEVNNRLLHEPYDPPDSEREADVRSHSSSDWSNLLAFTFVFAFI